MPGIGSTRNGMFRQNIPFLSEARSKELLSKDPPPNLAEIKFSLMLSEANKLLSFASLAIVFLSTNKNDCDVVAMNARSLHATPSDRDSL